MGVEQIDSPSPITLIRNENICELTMQTDHRTFKSI